MNTINKDEIISKLKDYEIMKKAVSGNIEDDNIVYFIAINEVINLINECNEYDVH